jgi:threonine dehydrogenase-like Zn-dependent dehydrogenase
MADCFGVPSENLMDTHIVDDLRATNAALIEPLGCVVKSIRASGHGGGSAAVVGLGAMGLLHLAMLDGAQGFDVSANRVEWARAAGFAAFDPAEAGPAETVFVCPGNQGAFEFALKIVIASGTVVMFAPMEPTCALSVPQSAYFKDVRIVNSYSCARPDCLAAIEALRSGRVSAERVCSDFISLERLPEYYGKMKRAEVLKPMVVWDFAQSHADR